MRKTEIIHHTADKGIRVQADSLKELFTAVLEGMAAIQVLESLDDGDEIQERIKVEAPDQTALLIDFLSEVLTLSDIHNAVFNRVSFELLTEKRVEATVHGIRVQTLDEDIKAVTHSQAEIITNEEGLLETIIIFDI